MLLAPSKLLVRFGALASFDVSPQDVGQQAAMLLIQWLNGQLDTTEHTWSVAHRVPVINRTTMKWNRLRMPRFIKKGAVFYD